MLAAESHEVACMAQAALAAYSPFIRAHLGVPDERAIVCGISSGTRTTIIRVEFGAIGPVPFCAMMLRIWAPTSYIMRGRAQSDQRADILLEGNRPGVMEKLGLGPACAWRAIHALCTVA